MNLTANVAAATRLGGGSIGVSNPNQKSLLKALSFLQNQSVFPKNIYGDEGHPTFLRTHQIVTSALKFLLENTSEADQIGYGENIIKLKKGKWQISALKQKTDSPSSGTMPTLTLRQRQALVTIEATVENLVYSLTASLKSPPMGIVKQQRDIRDFVDTFQYIGGRPVEYFIKFSKTNSKVWPANKAIPFRDVQAHLDTHESVPKMHFSNGEKSSVVDFIL